MKVFLKPPQWAVFSCDQRFRVLVAGRRFGKTYLAMVELCQAAWKTRSHSLVRGPVIQAS
jgi:hypothetical protein